MKRNFFIFAVVVLIFGFLAPQTQAAGLVPCGGIEEPPCTLCHIFVMFKSIIDYALQVIVPILAVLIIVYGGFLLLTSGGDPVRAMSARKILTSVVIGLALVFCSWLIINSFFLLIGVADWTGLREGWFIINCEVREVQPDPNAL